MNLTRKGIAARAATAYRDEDVRRWIRRNAMAQPWRSIEIFLPASLSMDDVRTRVRGDILCTASECGEFVRRIRLGTSTAHSDGWRKWSASYLPGPPGLFRG